MAEVNIDGRQDITGFINSVFTLTGCISSISALTGSIDIIKSGEIETYDGLYEVIPEVKDLTLETKNKKMTDDLLIRKIPYYETSNQTGTTVYIGGD